jgi:hypothetical protein
MRPGKLDFAIGDLIITIRKSAMQTRSSLASRSRGRLIPASLAWVFLWGYAPPGEAPRILARAQEATPSVLERFLARQDPGPTQYRALRRLEARNQRFGASAWMDVWTESDRDGAFRYEVAAEGGSGYIRRRVFRAALDGEQKLWREGEPQRAALTLENYVIEDRGAADSLALLGVKPRRKDVLLFEGTIFVQPEDADLVRIEGRLSKNPSFWTRRVDIVRRYGRVADVRVPLEIESVARVFLAGRSTFRMTYEYETVNDQRVGNPQPRVSTVPDEGQK